MSNRAAFITTLCLCFATTAALATPKNTKISTPTSQPAKTGSVQKALEKLYEIPRSAINKKRPPNKTTQANTPKRKNKSTTPKSNRIGLQHRDPIRNSVSSVPINDDINAPIHKDMNAQQQEGMPSFFMTPYPYNQHRSHGLSDRQRSWNNYRYFGGRPGHYGYARHGYDHGYGDDYQGDTYRYGFMRGYNVGRFDQTGYVMQENALRRHKIFLERALVLFREGKYHEAASTFKLAAESNQSDPAARIYTAHALFAIGRYKDAVGYLRNAFKLQPKIAKLYYDVRDDYGNPAEFQKQFDQLEIALKLAPSNINRLIVKGYLLYYTNQRDHAYQIFAKAKNIAPENILINLLIDNCQPPDVILDQMKNNNKQ